MTVDEYYTKFADKNLSEIDDLLGNVEFCVSQQLKEDPDKFIAIPELHEHAKCLKALWQLRELSEET
jgi:hypothetical protein